jgi:hypothetical protein
MYRFSLGQWLRKSSCDLSSLLVFAVLCPQLARRSTSVRCILAYRRLEFEGHVELKVNSRLAKVWQRAVDILNPLASMDAKATDNLRVPKIKALKVGCQRLLAGLAFSVSDEITG